MRLEISPSVNPDDASVSSTKEVCRLQRWSEKWNCYIDVTDAGQICDDDKLITVYPCSSGAVASFKSSAGKVNLIVRNFIICIHLKCQFCVNFCLNNRWQLVASFN